MNDIRSRGGGQCNGNGSFCKLIPSQVQYRLDYLATWVLGAICLFSIRETSFKSCCACVKLVISRRRRLLSTQRNNGFRFVLFSLRHHINLIESFLDNF